MALLLLSIFVFLTAFSFQITAVASSVASLTSCLTHKNILNFTTQNNPSVFTSLLDFSLQNLRFTESSFSKPIAIILPQSPHQVQDAWACIRNGNWTLRVRSGGHSYEGLSSVANAPFVILDLMNMHSVVVDLASKTAWVESGATLGELYYAISQKTSSYGFSAGTCATIGVGGHLSGGGYGMLSRKYGVGADNVLEAQLVTANGVLLKRVRATDQDLFWALRGGGGGSWGIVVAWKIKLVPVPSIVTTFSSWKTGKQLITDLVYRWQSAAPTAPEELFIAVYMAGISTSGGNMDMGASFYGQHLGNISETVALFDKFYPELGITAANCQEGNWIQAIANNAGLSNSSDPSTLTDRKKSSKDYFKAKSDYVKTIMSKQALAGAFQIMEQNSKGWMIFEPYGGVMNNILSDAIAFPHRAGNLFVIQYQAVWGDDTNSPDASLISWVRGLYNYMGTYVSQAPRAAYVNYIDLDLGDGATAGKLYFLQNFERLVQIKGRVDPKNLFANPQSLPTS